MYLNKTLTAQPSTLAAQSLTAAADVQIFSIFDQMDVLRVYAKIQSAVVTVAPAVVQFVKRPTTGSATGEVVVGTLNIPTGLAPGQTVYKDLILTPAQTAASTLQPGQELIVRVFSVAATSGTIYGQFVGQEDPEVPLNDSNLVLST